jgi:hypothetical protein
MAVAHDALDHRWVIGREHKMIKSQGSLNEVPNNQPGKKMVSEVIENPYTVTPPKVVFRKAGKNVETGRLKDQHAGRHALRYNWVKIELMTSRSGKSAGTAAAS